ncbi:anucleate primary sterigmata protein A [Aspergillus bombycis]|uniref:Anucleate primary sterigmata protein A n=1 Tax=Aspergillus bombycis TaxID=109264 RepID=A0A1F7ZT28_9EURO|nr:anucleate primary sterigmata protein A [Aspergillus bombycis]OGM42602.1 anucleate primary sterigmata protein A [Aspergillus bombycis]
MDDPFVSPTEAVVPRESHRYSSFDTQLFSLDASSPAQVKRALEAHLAETERRLEEASKLGTALIEQQKELEDKLKEVEQHQEASQIGPDLQRKLVDLEREYREIGRETARAFLAPKRLAGGDDGHLGTPSLDQKSPLSPALFAGQATNSPSKVSVPSRKQRNQPSSRVHDIEFATEISTSLLAQVRQLQALLAEREEALRTVNLEKSRLELEAEGYTQRIRALDESEERYKDENWALETQTRELMSAVKDAADRESRLNGSLGAVTTEKSTLERELEDLKQTNAKLIEDQTAAQKANDAEIHLLRRNLNSGDAERLALQKKVEELNSQNEELARAVAMRLRQQEAETVREVHRDDDSDEDGRGTPENSPPPSPNKFTPRHNQLETETLRSSLGHAHRMIQNLKSTIHREKTEKIELKRMLQEARDEVEQKRREAVAPAGPSNKRQKTKPDNTRKAARPNLLGAGRRGMTEIEEVHETDWEDHATDTSPSHKAALRSYRSRPELQSSDEPSDAYHTATEADDAFETANEREATTESEAFQTGVESMADDSTDTDELTETEDRIQLTPRARVSSLTLAKARDRKSYQSTASTSGEEDEDSDDMFPSPSRTSTPRHRLRNKRSVMRRIRPSGEAPMASSSRPSSSRESPATSFTQTPGDSEGQSLFAELAELDGEEDEEGEFGPPIEHDADSTPRILSMPDSRRSSQATLNTRPKPAMVDSGVMTDPWEPSTPAVVSDKNVSNVLATPPSSDSEIAAGMREQPELVHAGAQWASPQTSSEVNGDQLSSVPAISKVVSPTDAERELTVPAAMLPQLEVSPISTQDTVPVAPKLPELSMSYVVGGSTEPIAAPISEPAEMTLSAISLQYTEPVSVKLPEPEPKYTPEVVVSSIFSEETQPIAATLPEPVPEPSISLAEQATNTDIAQLVYSAIFSEHTEPVMATLPEPVPVPVPVPEAPVSVTERAMSTEVPDLAVSTIFSEQTLPVMATLPEPVPEPSVSVAERAMNTEIPGLAVSTIFSQHTEPVTAMLPEPVPELESTVVVGQAAAEHEVPDLTVTFIPPESTEPIAPKEREIPAPACPQFSVSTIRSVETLPVKATPAAAIIPAVLPSDENAPLLQTRGVMVDKSTSESLPIVVVEDVANDSSDYGTTGQKKDVPSPLSAISGNAVPRHARRRSSNQADQGAQTILSSKQIDQILMDRVTARPLSPPDSDKAKEQGNSPAATPRARPHPQHQSSAASLNWRPGSAASQASTVHSHPPLPAEHKEAVMTAEKKSLDQQPATPGLMAPPLAPASALRAPRPRTPNDSAAQVGSIRSSTSRARVRRESQVSRRSSVSSFASEIEERFNTHSTPAGGPYGYGSGTDPRMIQAITQTMIGEFLWKYTRKTVSGEISNTRHRRYFWVHPYTRTLYWSEQDPQSAGKSERKTKSVPIEAVRVVADDNPYPPGLHCRSLEVVSPGRRIRFTATTSQRHETWFNALSYLLLRSENGEEETNDLEDIDEFNPGFRSGSRSRQRPRLSISSSQSRTTRNWPKQRAGSGLSLRRAGTPGRASPALSTPSHYSDQRNSSTSRLSTILNTTLKGSFGRKGPPSYATSSIHDGSVYDRDSEEDLRQMMERQEQETDRLENVRACCDGKHDVSSLSRTSRYSPRANRHHSHH